MTIRRVPIQQWLLAAVMLVAIAYRARYFLQIEHNLDRAYPIWQALQTLDEGYWPLVGQGTSILFANPAGLGYFYIPLFFAVRSVLAPYVVVIALNTLGVFLTYRIGSRLLGWRVGLVAALLLAVNPWVIEYSRYTWPPALLPFFGSALLWLLFPVFLKQARQPNRRLILAAILLALMTQTTLIAFFILLPIGVLGMLFLRHLPRRALIVGGLVYVLIQAPYFVGLIQTWGTVQAEITEFGEQSRISSLRPDALQHAFRLVSGEDYEMQRGLSAPIADQPLRHLVTLVLSRGIAFLLIVGIALALWKVIRPRQPSAEERNVAIVLLVWFLAPIIAMSYNASPVHPYYQLVGLPAGHLLVGWAVNCLFSRRYGLVIAIILVPFTILMGVNSERHFQETAHLPGAHRLSALSLEWGLRLGDAIRAHLPEGGLVFADESEWIISSLAEMSLDYRQEGRFPDVLIVPARGGLVVSAYVPQESKPLLPYAERASQLLLPDGWMLTIDAFQPNSMRRAIVQSPLADGEKWLSLLKVDIEQEANTVIVTSTWHVDAVDAGLSTRSYAPFIHVFDANDERTLIVDGRPIAGYQWEVGDLHIHQMRFSLPSSDGPFRMMIGQYDSLADENLIFILPDGTYTALIPISESVHR